MEYILLQHIYVVKILLKKEYKTGLIPVLIYNENLVLLIIIALCYNNWHWGILWN